MGFFACLTRVARAAGLFSGCFGWSLWPLIRASVGLGGVIRDVNAGCARRRSAFRVLLVVSLAADPGVGWLWWVRRGCLRGNICREVLVGLSVAVTVVIYVVN